MIVRSRLVAIVAAVVLLVSACADSAGSASSGGTDLFHVAVPAAPLGLDAAAEPTGPDLGLLGQGSLEGQDVVVWFWAEW